jgi:hypothetical protein
MREGESQGRWGDNKPASAEGSFTGLWPGQSPDAKRNGHAAVRNTHLRGRPA